MNGSTTEDILVLKVEELDLSCRAFCCLKRANLNTVEDVAALRSEELPGIVRNFGKKCADEAIAALHARGVPMKGERLCPVCGAFVGEASAVCTHCGFSQLGRKFESPEEREAWLANVVEPCRSVFEHQHAEHREDETT